MHNLMHCTGNKGTTNGYDQLFKGRFQPLTFYLADMLLAHSFLNESGLLFLLAIIIKSLLL